MSSQYFSLAPFYDRLTTDVDYDAFISFYEELFDKAGLNVKTVLDLACGTGTLTCKMASRGYEMICADASEEMLLVAAEKIEKENFDVKPLMLNQRMEELDLYGTVDAVICSLDGINYVEPSLLPEVFRRLYLFTEPGGMVVFDINSPHKLKHLDGEVCIDETDEVYCVWRTEYDEDESACFYGMDIFFCVDEEKDIWQRSFEEHIEYVHQPEKLEKLLLSAGFEDVRQYGDRSLLTPENDEKRIFFTCRKPKCL